MRGCRVYHGGLSPGGIPSTRSESRRHYFSNTKHGRGSCRSAQTFPDICDDVEAVVSNRDVQILDVAVPPDCQLDIIRRALSSSHNLKGILAQKPLGVNFAEAAQIVRMCEDAGVTLAVNQNMRFDQSVVSVSAFDRDKPARSACSGHNRHASDSALDAMAAASGLGDV